MELCRNVGGRLLRCGYTTGSCAAAAAKAAGLMLLTGRPLEKISIHTPKGIPLTLDLQEVQIGPDYASCGVRKDSGDDPDVTNGVLVFARVERRAHGIFIDGGEGVGRVTRPGLDRPVGAAAINRVPREMIAEGLRAAAERCGYEGGFSAVISIPGGAELAKRTFNPRIGIEGGISVIGTTGIVEPMSHQAMADTVRLEIRQLRESGARRLLLTPGNYGETFAAGELGLSLSGHVNCSNFIGGAVDCAVELEFLKILLVGHIGKLVKLGLGMANTHSAFGDGRMEALLACAVEAGAEGPLLVEILRSVTTDAALALIEQAGFTKKTMDALGKRIAGCLTRRVPEGVEIGFVCFTNAEPLRGILTKSENADLLIREWTT